MRGLATRRGSASATAAAAATSASRCRSRGRRRRHLAGCIEFARGDHGRFNLRRRRLGAWRNHRRDDLPAQRRCLAIDRRLALEVDGLRGEVDVGAPLDERLHRVDLAGGDREDQRRLSEFRVARVRVGARVHEHGDGLDAARGGCEVQRRCARGRRDHRLQSGLEQCPEHGCVAVARRQMERRVPAEAGHGRHVRAREDEGVSHRGLAALGRPVKRRHAVRVGHARIGALFQQRAHRREIAAPGGVGHRR